MEWLLIIAAVVLSGASIVVALNSRAHARLALRESQKAIAAKDDAEHALISILDEDGNVRGRLALPGEVPEPPPPPPTKTPCGNLCRLAFFTPDGRLAGGGARYGTWNCQAGQGAPCDSVRSKFLDDTNNCVMFERDDDC